MKVVVCFVVTLLSSVAAVSAQSLQETLEDTLVGERWQYNDWEAAKAAAAKSKKPILALFR